MNTRTVLPLAVLALAASVPLAAAMASDTRNEIRITDLPRVTVRPASQDAAYFRAHRIVDLPRITVRPESADLALFLTADSARVSRLPLSLSQASVSDERMGAASDALAAR